MHTRDPDWFDQSSFLRLRVVGLGVGPVQLIDAMRFLRYSNLTMRRVCMDLSGDEMHELIAHSRFLQQHYRSS